MTFAFDLAGGAGYHRDFTLSITKALGDQLAAALEGLDRAPLNEDSIATLKEKPGVYQLYLDDEFVYVGKADKKMPARLRDHLRKLGGRRNISLEDITFSCLYVAEDFSALAPEQLLISHHKEVGQIPWNNNGFGNKDPGRNRDSTVLKVNHFDMEFPIDLDRRVDGLVDGAMSLVTLLGRLKSSLPYNFRYQASGYPSDQLVKVSSDMTADRVFRAIAKELPETWQIVALMGYVIMYADKLQSYPSAWRYYRNSESFDAEPASAPSDSDAESDDEDE